MGRRKYLVDLQIGGLFLTIASIVAVTQAQSLSAAGGQTPVGVFAESSDSHTPGSVTEPQTRSSVARGGDLGSGVQNSLRPERSSREVNEERAEGRWLAELPPEEPTEFQRLLTHTLGKDLPIYGSSMFRNVPSTFAPLDRVPVTPDYKIGPGDELLIQIWGQVTLDSRFVVDRTGNIFIPKLGTLRVAGLSFEQLQGYLKTQAGRVFRNFDLNVNMGQLRSIQIFVLGQARRPGSYTISSLSTLVDALFETGGPTLRGSLRHIQLKRSGSTVVDLDLYELLQHGDKSKDAQLLPGDVIYIPPSGPRVAVAGNVNEPAIYELKPGADTLGAAFDMAAGRTNVAAAEKVRVERIEAHAGRSLIEVTLNEAGRATVLQDGDVVEVVAVIDRYKDAVILRGNVANPGHYTLKPGMRVGDLFPDRGALVTRDYWLELNRLGQPGLEYLPECAPGSTRERTDGAGKTPESGCGYATTGTGLNMPPKNSDAASAQLQAKLALPTAGQQSVGQPGASSTAAATVEQDTSRFEARNDIVLSEPDIDWSYAVIERQSRETLTTSLLSFNLGRLVLEGDMTQNLILEPGDVITIFSKADIRVPQAQQTRLVHLEGEFVSSGVYSVLPGETLQQLVKRAGGLSPDAYLFGSEFTRESTRRMQQERLNEYVNQIELQAATNAANSTGRAVGVEDTAIAAASQAQSRTVIGTLRQARSTGRIVLGVSPGGNTVSQLPPVPLEDGDRFIVPQVPSMVSVAGAVYNPNSFLYDEHRRVRNYLEIAGGANRDADKSRAYVIRADGSVVSRQQLSALYRDRFEALRIYPGDTIVVPVNLNKGRAIRNIVDVSQIVGQFGLAIAAARLVF